MSRLWGDRNNPIWRTGPRNAENLDQALRGIGSTRKCPQCGREMTGNATVCPKGHFIGLNNAGPVTGGGCMFSLLYLSGTVILGLTGLATYWSL